MKWAFFLHVLTRFRVQFVMFLQKIVINITLICNERVRFVMCRITYFYYFCTVK